MKYTYKMKSLFKIGKKQSGMRFIDQCNSSRIVFDIAHPKNKVAFGFNGAGKSTLTRSMFEFFKQISQYNLNDPKTTPEEIRIQWAKYKASNPEKYEKSFTVGNNSIREWTFPMGINKRKVFSVSENGGEHELVVEFDTDDVTVIGGQNNGMVNFAGQFKAEALLTKIKYLDELIFSDPVKFLNSLKNSGDIEAMFAKIVEDMRKKTGESKKQMENIVKVAKINLSYKNHRNHLSHYQNQVLINGIGYTEKQIEKEMDESLSRTSISTILRQSIAHNIDTDALDKKVANGVISPKDLFKALWYIRLLDFVATNYSHNNVVSTPFQHMAMGFSLITHNSINFSGGLNALQTSIRLKSYEPMKAGDKYQKYCKSSYAKFKKKLQAKEIEHRNTAKKRAEINARKEFYFQLSGLNQEIDWDFKRNRYTYKDGAAANLSTGQNAIINLINNVSNYEFLSTGNIFLTIYDDPLDAVDYENMREATYMLFNANKNLRKASDKVYEIMFTHNLDFLDSYMNTYKIKKYDMLMKDKLKNTYMIHSDLDFKVFASHENLSYQLIKSIINDGKIHYVDPHVRVIYEWLNTIFPSEVIAHKFPASRAYLNTLNRGSHINGKNLSEMMIQKNFEKAKSFLRELEIFLPKKFS